MVIPGRSCVARILFAPDAYGVLRQAATIYKSQSIELGL